uniref:Uncharacterized protein n=1 Tax=Anopheles minimus TaxID=112268 RepID=A0A182W4H6_9DIPT
MANVAEPKACRREGGGYCPFGTVGLCFVQSRQCCLMLGPGMQCPDTATASFFSLFAQSPLRQRLVAATVFDTGTLGGTGPGRVEQLTRCCFFTSGV